MALTYAFKKVDITELKVFSFVLRSQPGGDIEGLGLSNDAGVSALHQVVIVPLIEIVLSQPIEDYPFEEPRRKLKGFQPDFDETRYKNDVAQSFKGVEEQISALHEAYVELKECAGSKPIITLISERYGEETQISEVNLKSMRKAVQKSYEALAKSVVIKGVSGEFLTKLNDQAKNRLSTYSSAEGDTKFLQALRDSLPNKGQDFKNDSLAGVQP